MLVFYAILITTIAFLLFGMDKQRANNREWRISESNLLLAAIMGGAFGAKIGQKLFRHKTKKEPFKSVLNVCLVCNIAAYGFIGYKLL